MPARRSLLIFLGLAALAALFIRGAWDLMEIRFASGDTYAANSTLNSGPKGSRALFESLDTLPGHHCERNFVPLSQLKPPGSCSLFLIGSGENVFGEDSEENFEKVEDWMEAGTHLILAVSADSLPGIPPVPVNTDLENPWDATNFYTSGTGTPPKPGSKSKSTHKTQEGVTAAAHWDFRWRSIAHREDIPKDGWETKPTTGMAPVSKLPRWRSPLRFVKMGKDWQTLASVGGEAVAIGRRFGKGSLVLLTDSTSFTNEALWRSVQPEFLLWMTGGRSRIIFDETHLGTASDPGVMTLARRYRFHGLMAGLALLLALFIWRGATSLVPRDELTDLGHGSHGHLDGASSASGLIGLMKQSLRGTALLRACFTEWAKNPVIRRRHSDAQVTAVRDLITTAEAGKIPLVETYRQIATLLKRRG